MITSVLKKAEDELLILFSKLRLNEDDLFRIKDLFNSKIDWGYLVLNCQCHKTLGLLYHHIVKNNLIPFVQNRVFKLLKTNYVYCARKYEIYRKEFNKLVTILHESKVEYTIIKGFSLIDKIYADVNPYVREFKDIDILVNPNDITQVKKILLKHGYVQGEFNKHEQKVQESSREELLSWSAFGHELQSFVKEIVFDELSNNVNTIEVEVCHTIFEGGDQKPQIPTEELLKYTEYKKTNNKENYKAFTIELMLIQLCYHLYKDIHYDYHKSTYQDLTLQKFGDIRELIESFNEFIDWNIVDDLAKDKTINRALYFTFYFGNMIYNHSVLESCSNKYMVNDEEFEVFMNDYKNYFALNFNKLDFNKQ